MLEGGGSVYEVGGEVLEVGGSVYEVGGKVLEGGGSVNEVGGEVGVGVTVGGKGLVIGFSETGRH